MTLITYNLYLLTLTLTDDLDRLILLPSAIPTLTIDTPVPNIKQISYVKSGRLWVMSDFDDGIIQVDNYRDIKEAVRSLESFCVSKDDALLYKSDQFIEDEDENGNGDDNKYGDRILKEKDFTNIYHTA